MAKLLLIRHGQIKANVEGRWHGSTDSPLTWRGRSQASRTGRHLASVSSSPAVIYSSPLQRCRHTAERIAKPLALTPLVEEDLREYCIGEWEGKRFDELAAEHDFVTRATRDPEFAPPGGESLKAVSERIVSAVHGIHARHADEPETTVVLVSHGAVMAVLLGALLHETPARWIDYHFANCSLTELMLSPAPYVNFFNSTQHL